MLSNGNEAAYFTSSTSRQWSRWRDIGTEADLQTSAARFTRWDLKVVRAQGKSKIMAGDLRASAARAVAMISSRLYFERRQ